MRILPLEGSDYDNTADEEQANDKRNTESNDSIHQERLMAYRTENAAVLMLEVIGMMMEGDDEREK